jgi:hypothetical protein
MGSGSRTVRCSLNFIAVGLLTAADVAIQHRPRLRHDTQGQEDQPRLPRQPYGKEPIGAGRARQAQRLTFKAIPVTHPASSKSHSGWRSVDPARLRAALGLGRDELHPIKGGGGRLSARQDDRRVVVGRRPM